jgi:uncharacterized membrane protein YfcA
MTSNKAKMRILGMAFILFGIFLIGIGMGSLAKQTLPGWVLPLVIGVLIGIVIGLQISSYLVRKMIRPTTKEAM